MQARVISNLTTTFEYDDHSRLKSATLGSGAVRTYKFDKDGQQNSKGNLELKDKRRMAYATDKTYPVSDEVYDTDAAAWKSNQTFSWSATGALLTKGPFTFSYDSNNMMTKAVETETTTTTAVAAESKFYYDHTGQRFLKTHLRGGVMIKTWYLGDGIEIREKFTGATSTGAGSFDAMQATKYIYGIDDKKLASITGSVKTMQLGATASTLFALADGFSSTTVTGLAFKTFYTFYGIYAHENTGKTLRIGGLSIAAILLLLYLICSQRDENAFPIWMRLAAATMMVSFASVNCGTGNVPGSTPVDLGGSPGAPGALGTQGDANTAAQPANTFISALYTGLPTGTVYYSHNHLGSGALVTDVNGAEIFRITYTEYGEIDLENSGKWNSTTEEFERTVTDAEIAITAVKYTGQEYDPETGFYYYNARYYDPQLGIFTTADTEFDKDQGNFAFNRHMYVRGNPVMYTDPTGHFFFWALAQLVGLAAGAGAGAGAAARGAATGDWSAKNLAIGAGQGLVGAGAIALGVATGGAAFSAYAGGLGSFGAAVTGGAVGGYVGGFAGGAGSAWVGGASFADGFAAGMIGGLVGAAGGMVGGAGNAWVQGADFGDGLAWGMVGGVLGAFGGFAGGAASYGTAALLGDSLAASIATGAAGGMAGGFVGGSLNGLAGGRSFGDAMLDGLTAGGWGGAIGGAVGAAFHEGEVSGAAGPAEPQTTSVRPSSGMSSGRSSNALRMARYYAEMDPGAIGNYNILDFFPNPRSIVSGFKNLYKFTKFAMASGKMAGQKLGSNQYFNKQVQDIATKLNLSKSQVQQLHRHISKQGYSYHEIMAEAKMLFNK